MEPTARPQCSLIVPAYNRRRQLLNTLTSLAYQSCPPTDFEVVVVDDGSTDGTRDALLGGAWPFRLVYVRKDNRNNRSESRNTGVLAAHGGVLIFVDADMLCPPGFVEAHLSLHRRFGPCVVCGWHWRVPMDLGTPLPTDWLRRVVRMGSRGKCHPGINTAPDLCPFVTANASCLRADAVEVGLFDEAFVGYGHEDLDLGMRLHLLGRRFVSDPATMAYHQHHGASRQRGAEARRNVEHYYRKHHGRRRVLHLSDYMVAGGIERFVVGLAHPPHRQQQRFEWVAAHRPDHFAGDLAELKVPVEQVGYEDIGSYLARHPVEAIHVHSHTTWLDPVLEAAPTTPIVVTLHSPAPFTPRPGVRRLVCVSRGLARRQHPGGIPCYVIHPGTTPGAFLPTGRRAEVRRALGVPEDAFVVGSVARLDDSKVSGRMLEVYAELLRLQPLLHVLLVGTGTNYEQHVAWVHAQGLSDRLHLPGATRDVSGVLDALDVFAHAVEEEPFGIAVLEAMAKGLPVVVAGLMGPSETIVDGESGFLCANAYELVERVLELAGGRHDREALGRNARARARLFDERRTAMKYKLVYDEVVDGARYWWPEVR
jgi:glycosyltransferase involved in cell wall biosynthesis